MMRIRVGAVNIVSKLLLLAVVVCFYVTDLGGAFGVRGAGQIMPKGYFLAFYLMTLLAFCAFPRRRRGDIAKLMILAAAVAQIGRRAEGLAPSLPGLAAAAGGAYAVFIPSFLERFRALTRTDSKELFSLVFKGERRRRRISAQPAQPAASGVMASEHGLAA